MWNENNLGLIHAVGEASVQQQLGNKSTLDCIIIANPEGGRYK